MSTIQPDVADTDIAAFTDNDIDGSALFLASFADKPDAKKKPSEDADGETATDETVDTEGSEETLDNLGDDENAGDEDNENADDATPAEKKYVEDDGLYLKIKVGDEDKEVPVKDLKRLYGQEASLTQKSVEVANARKSAEAEQQKHVTALNVLLQRATEQANPYRNIDWMAISKDPNITAEAASALRADAQKYLDNENFLGQQLNAFMTEVNNQNTATRAESAKACVATLTKAPTAEAPNDLYIKGWDSKTYDDIRAFGVKMGMPKDIVNGVVDPAAIKMMHMAMLYARGSQRVVTTKAVNKTPQKIVKNSSSVTARPTKASADKTSAIGQLRKSGSIDDAQNAFLASFAD